MCIDTIAGNLPYLWALEPFHYLFSFSLRKRDNTKADTYCHVTIVVCVRSSSQMTLQVCLEECMEALDLFLNNHFSESLDKLRPR